MEKIELVEQEKRRRKNEIPALLWLAEILKIDDRELSMVLNQVRDGPYPYRTLIVRKNGGGKRELSIPSKYLKRIQRRINKKILCDFPIAENVYGFSGGSIDDAIKPHLEAKSILSFDIRNAFPSVHPYEVFGFLTRGRDVKYHSNMHGQTDFSWYGPYRKLIKSFVPGYMSWYAARAIMQLTTYKNQLPQGVPTSPKLFDLSFSFMDEILNAFAEKIGANYTRYADNIFFSMNEEEFPKPVKNAVLRKTRREGFKIHKIKTKRLTGKDAVRILGLNMIEGKVHNIRNFKRALRLSIHHVAWLLDHGQEDTPEFDKAWWKLQGQMNFAKIDTLPQKLLNEYLELEKRLS